MFLLETKLEAQFKELKKFSLGLDNCLGVDSVRRSGGIVLLWKKESNLTILNFL